MENIRQAVELAKAQMERPTGRGLGSSSNFVNCNLDSTGKPKQRTERIGLDLAHLQSQRIVAYDGKDNRSRSFDILRAEVLQSMDLKGWRVLAVTSPTPSCGKTLVATNLALSMGRQPERQVFLIDLDLRKPRVATSLGLKCRDGLLGVIEGRTNVESAIVQISAGQSRLDVLPTAETSSASDLVASSEMSETLRDVARYGQSKIIILDLPPLLTGHDVISILPHVDCVLLVAATGHSKVSDIEACEKHLKATDVVRVVLNKAPESTTDYAYY
jgi:protein-tyrosine kinase